jgi:hypothetical protein
MIYAVSRGCFVVVAAGTRVDGNQPIGWHSRAKSAAW